MNSASAVSTAYNYRSVCKHCGVKPFSEGPHHDSDCARHRATMATESELARRKECRYCGVRPFVAGAHHEVDCRRFFEVESTGVATATDDEDGPVRPTEQVTPGTVLDAFESAEVPLLTAEEVAEALDCSTEAAHSGLAMLADGGHLHRKPVGRDAEVFLPTDASAGAR